ncbi:MAG: SDR family NAD(P)-dependent oxidoreductase [Ktedonobacterales bacterium]|nr:SDR family NAD(P)-dependent oxidoreductase [Ktedonobacterales bacterium]
MAHAISRAVLVTGTSSGIGKATALRLAAHGWRVYATARRSADIADLAQSGCQTLALDVTDEASMVAAIAQVEAAEGALGVLINNAGYSQSGAIATVPIDQVRREFETNVFGLARLVQLVVPGMRRQHWGKIINLSSMGGRLTFPGGGYYHASKYAVEALTDALRFEVGGFGIDAVLIEPGLIRSRFGETAATSVAPATTDDDPYAAFNASVAKISQETYQSGPLARLGGTPEDVAATIERAITARRPRTRYLVTPSARVLLTLRTLLSDRQWDGFLRGQMTPPQ